MSEAGFNHLVVTLLLSAWMSRSLKLPRCAVVPMAFCEYSTSHRPRRAPPHLALKVVLSSITSRVSLMHHWFVETGFYLLLSSPSRYQARGVEYQAGVLCIPRYDAAKCCLCFIDPYALVSHDHAAYESDDDSTCVRQRCNPVVES